MPDDTNTDTDIELLKTQLTQMTETCKRTLADFANYKKFVEEQRKQAASFIAAETLKELLPIIDNLERAIQAMTELDPVHRQGIEAIHRQLTSLLEKRGVKKIETVGSTFNPALHEVLSQEPGELNIITKEVEKGYTIGDQILKPAKVIVGNGNAQNAQ